MFQRVNSPAVEKRNDEIRQLIKANAECADIIATLMEEKLTLTAELGDAESVIKGQEVVIQELRDKLNQAKDAFRDAENERISLKSKVMGAADGEFVLVPTHPTDKMIERGLTATVGRNFKGSALAVNREMMKIRYRAMINEHLGIEKRRVVT